MVVAGPPTTQTQPESPSRQIGPPWLLRSPQGQWCCQQRSPLSAYCSLTATEAGPWAPGAEHGCPLPLAPAL